MTDLELGVTCDCCNKEPAIGAAAVPGMPVTIAWCATCLNANVVPYSLAVVNTVRLGGVDNTAHWWQALVRRTLEYFGKTRAEFEADVAAETVPADPQDEEAEGRTQGG